MHVVEQVGGGARRAAPVVGDLAVGEELVHLARMHDAALAHELEQRLRAPLRDDAPRRLPDARVHQRLLLARQEAVVDEVVLLDRELRIAPLEVTGAIVLHAMAQRQVLRTRRRADRVGLHEAELVDRAPEGRGREQAARDGVAAQVGEGGVGHRRMMPKEKGRLASPFFDPRCAAPCAEARQKRLGSPPWPPLKYSRMQSAPAGAPGRSRPAPPAGVSV